MAEVKGSAIVARARFVRDRWDEPTWRRIKDGLGEAHRDRMAGRVLPHAWVPFELFVDLNLTIDRELGEGDLALCREMGAYGAQVNLPTLYRLFYRLGKPSFILNKAARLWDVHYSSGRLVVEEGSDGAVMKIEAFDTPHRVHCLSVAGWAERSVQLSGGKQVSVEEHTCRALGDETCELMVRWR